MSDGFASAVLDADDAFAANELFQANGWTDGLPIVPPTKGRAQFPRRRLTVGG